MIFLGKLGHCHGFLEPAQSIAPPSLLPSAKTLAVFPIVPMLSIPT